MRPIKTCFNRQLAEICQQSILIEDLSHQVKKRLPAELQDYCDVGSFDKGCLTLCVTDASWATPLRYLIPELRDTLRTEAGFYKLTSIKIAIQALPHTPPKAAKKKAPSLSEEAKATIISESQSCSYQPLQKALIRLAEAPQKNDA